MDASAPRKTIPHGAAALVAKAITEAEFQLVRKLAYDIAGISMAAGKKMLVESRLHKRLAAVGVNSYREYLEHIGTSGHEQELQTAIDLLTTNETYFFREPQHFTHLQSHVMRNRKLGQKLRIWSAACSSGEEPYSIAMLLASARGGGAWEVLASDLSTRVLERARCGHYPMERARGISQELLRAFCLRGTGSQSGTMLVDSQLRSRVQFRQLNLIQPLPSLGLFDVIFLRNVMIYFDMEVKRRVIANLLPMLVPGGFFYIGHSETLNGVTQGLTQVQPAIYVKEGT